MELGIVGLVLRRAKFLILFSFSVVLLIAIINYPGFSQIRITLLNTTISEIREAVNPTIPLLAAILVGIFVQAMAIVYKLVYDTIQAHKEDIDRMIDKLLESRDKGISLSRSGGFMTATLRINEESNKASFLPTFESPKIHLWIEAPIRDKLYSVKDKFGQLWEDMVNHYPDIKQGIEEICYKVSSYNNKIIRFRRLCDKTLESLLDELENLDQDLRGRLNQGGFQLLLRHLIDVVLYEILQRSDNARDRIDNIIMNLNISNMLSNEINSLGPRTSGQGTFEVGSYVLGKITDKEWNNKIKPLLIKIANKFFEECSKDLQKILEEGLTLEKDLEKRYKTITSELEYIRTSRVLRIKRICKYIH